jgi:predicted ATP-grasp superfamily ATP-dependent carboligase
MVTKHIPELIDAGRTILEGIGYNGYSLIEFKRDSRDGVFKLMDVNGRPNGSLRQAVTAGVNFPWIQYQYF